RHLVAHDADSLVPCVAEQIGHERAVAPQLGGFEPGDQVTGVFVEVDHHQLLERQRRERLVVADAQLHRVGVVDRAGAQREHARRGGPDGAPGHGRLHLETVGAALDADAGGGEPGGYAPRLMTVGRAGTPGGGDLQGEDPWLSWRQRRAYRRWRAAPKIPGFLDDGHEAQGDLDVFLARERRRLVADAGADEKLHAVRCQAELEPRAWTGHRHLFGPHQRRPFGEAAVQVDAFWREVDALVVLEQ